MPFREVKHKLNGSQQVFDCELLFQSDDAIIVRFVATEEPYISMAHHSEGYFWRDRNYLMYKMFRENDDLVGYRLDVCRDVQFGSEQVDWTDLVLDARVSPGYNVSIEDEDEVTEAIAAGLLSPADQQIIATTKRIFETGITAIVSDAERLRESTASKLGGGVA